MFDDLQKREIFHLTFLRRFVGRVKPGTYAVKGGCNLRFFYNSIRYSEDMDIDIKEIEVFKLKDIVIDILNSQALSAALKPFQIEKIVPPRLETAKQTETVQRFKVHLLTASGVDLFTKMEFSRRGIDAKAKAEPVSAEALRPYRQPPLIVSHYLVETAIKQKIEALADRTTPQSRDVFDIYLLHSQIGKDELGAVLKLIAPDVLKAAQETIFKLKYQDFKDAVCAYLSSDDYESYAVPAVWEEIQLRVSEALSGES